MKWFRYGPNAWLLQFADTIGEEAFFRGRSIVTELEHRPPRGLIEFVPAFTTILLQFDPQQTEVETVILPELLSRLGFGSFAKIHSSPVKVIPVSYNGPDLERVAGLRGLAKREVIARHVAAIYRVYMLGFSPGFPYLGDLDPALHTPRLDSPRPRVAAGSVAIGGQHTGIYTIETPGGWNVIGHTSLKVFDPDRGGLAGQDAEMFLLKPGDRVRFVPIREDATGNV